MIDQELGGNIVLSNFDLDNQEMIIIKKIVGNYAEKIRRLRQYKELKIEMRTHLKAKNKNFEINARLEYDGGQAIAEAQGLNPFVLTTEILKKILNEVEHKH